MNQNNESQDNEYTAEDIVHLEFPECVRRRPGMYIGSTNKTGLHQMAWEIIDNAIDEALVGKCTRVQVEIHADGSLSVSDNGRGIPIEISAQTKLSTLETVFTKLHAGGKFNESAYGVSGGLHGVGASVVNALSEDLVVETTRKGLRYRQSYKRGLPATQVMLLGPTEILGTTVFFSPDRTIFYDIDDQGLSRTVEFDWDTLEQRLRELAFLNGGLTIELNDKRADQPRQSIFCYESGIEGYLDHLNAGSQPLGKPIRLRATHGKLQIESALQWAEKDGEVMLSFVNNVNTRDGGGHVRGLRMALANAFRAYISDYRLDKGSNQITWDDVKEGLTAIISLKLAQPIFEGQTKTKLANAEVQGPVTRCIAEELRHWLEHEPAAAKALVEHFLRAKRERELAAKQREENRRKQASKDLMLPGKLADCSEHNPQQSELYLVEGDSAGGSAKQGRNRQFQAVLPLRGKILNVEKVRSAEAFENTEIQAIVRALGFDLQVLKNSMRKTGDSAQSGHLIDLKTLRYNKIIIMTDADVDGSHIRALLLTFFFRCLPDLLSNGHVYIAQPPLYKILAGKRITYCYSKSELKAATMEMNSPYSIQRFKGLGEMMPEQLWQTTMNPETRTLKRVTVKDAKAADELFQLLMGDNVLPRRMFIESQVELAELDL